MVLIQTFTFQTKWCRNGVKTNFEMPQTLENKGDVNKNEIRYSGITKCW